MQQTPEINSELLPRTLEAGDLEALQAAHEQLEHPSLAARLSNVIGTPIEVALTLLPQHWYQALHGTVERAIEKSFSAALTSLRNKHASNAHDAYYKLLVGSAGAAGGFFGLPGLLLELPVTTTLMLRSIAEIARESGEDLHRGDSQAACLQVFALGGRSEMDDAADTGYYGVRLALAAYWKGGSLESMLAQTGAAAGLVHAVAARFGVDLSKRAAARLVPVAGAASGALVNTIFMQHFQEMARSHFTIRRLERKYGSDLVRHHYERLSHAK
jgi:hypothetical protein